MTKQTLTNAKSRAVATASARFTDALKPGVEYLITGDVDFWFALGDDDGAAVAQAAGAGWCPGGGERRIVPTTGAYLHVIRAAGVDGFVNIFEVVEVEV